MLYIEAAGNEGFVAGAVPINGGELEATTLTIDYIAALGSQRKRVSCDAGFFYERGQWPLTEEARAGVGDPWLAQVGLSPPHVVEITTNEDDSEK